MNMYKKILVNIMLVSTLTSLISTAASARDQGLTLSIDSKILYEDNIFRVKEKTQDTILKLAPTAEYRGLYGKYSIIGKYTGDYAKYDENSSASHDKHKLQTNARFDFTSKFSVKIGAEYAKDVEDPGMSIQVLNNIEEFNEFNSTLFTFNSSYGKSSSKGQLVFDYNNRSFRYKNNNQQYRDRTTDIFTGTFYWRVAQKLRLLVESRKSDTKSDNALGTNQGFKQTSYLTGISWEATAKTSGELRIGYQESKYDSQLIADISGVSFRANVDYKLDTDSIFELAVVRTTRDNPELVFAGLETTDVKLSWDKVLVQNINMQSAYIFRKDSFGSNVAPRKDNVQLLRTVINYQALQFLAITGGIELATRESNIESNEFDNGTIFLGMKITLD